LPNSVKPKGRENFSAAREKSGGQAGFVKKKKIQENLRWEEGFSSAERGGS